MNSRDLETVNSFMALADAYVVKKKARVLWLLFGTRSPAFECGCYPEVPTDPRIVVSDLGWLLPEAPGVYFIWGFDETEGESGRTFVEYVGQAMNLRARVSLGRHENLKPTDSVTYIQCSVDELDFSEHFYIGLLRPSRNGGRRAKPPRRSFGYFDDSFLDR